MSARKSKVVKVNISAGTYKDEAEAVREANAIKRWLIRYCDKNGYSIKGKVWISTNSAYAGRIINKGRKKEYKPNGKPLPTVVEAHIHMVLFCNPASTIVDALKSYLNKKHMKAVVWDKHCNSRAEVENAVEYAMRQSRKVRTIDYDRKDVLSVDEWGYYEAVERAEAKIKDNMAFTKSEPEQNPETLENKSVSSISDTPETLTYKTIRYNYSYYIVYTSYNHSIVKALLQNIIYYSRESSRSFCSKIIFKKVLLKVPCLLKKMSFYGIIKKIEQRGKFQAYLIERNIIMSTKDNSVIRFEIDETNITEQGNEETSLQAVEVEILPPVDISDKRKVEIYKGISELDEKLSAISSRVEELNTEIENLTNHADGIDYTVAVASGIIAGIIDSVWVGEFSIDRANDWGNEKVDNFVVKIAQSQGYEGNDLEGAIRYLEEKFPIAADKATNDFGGGLQHHLRDFSHHPTPVGLFFSLLTQFTGKVYGTDVAGVFKVVSVDATELIGKNLPEKITFGVVKWFFHMVSDMAGSSTSVGKGNLGTGLPGPLVSFLKEISALPIFRNMSEKGYKEFSVWISKLFNGTLLGKRDDNGKLIEAVKFDLRTEIGVAHEIGRQAVPVVVNECIVRGFYFARRLFNEIKENDVKCVSDLKNINWKNTLPFKNRTVVRMLTISTSTFMAFDIADAAIRSGGFNATCILRINFVGVGRFAVAIGTDIGMGIKKSKKESERMILRGEELQLLNAKVLYKEADMWIEAENTEKAIQETYIVMEKTATEFNDAWDKIKEGSENRKESIEKIKNNDKGFADELSDLLEWGV